MAHAVLRLVSQRSKTDLQNKVGLSARVAKNIVDARARLGGEFEDLADLDAVSFVGTRVFDRLLAYANATRMFRTSIRVPLVVIGSDGNLQTLTGWNDEARAVGKRTFARYTFVDCRTDYSEKMYAYQARLDEVFDLGGNDEVPEVFMFANGPSDFDEVEPHCYVGRGNEVASAAPSRSDDLFGDMFTVWAWQVDDESWVYEDFDTDGTLLAALQDHGLEPGEVGMMSSNSDDGGPGGVDVIGPCR